MSNYAKNVAKSLLNITLIVLLLSACSGNSFIISTVYNRADNSLAKNFYKYADFDQQQRATIKASVEQYHLWHRKTHLPEYVSLIKQIRTSVASDEALTLGMIENWTNETFKLRRQLIQCSPMMYASPLLQQLSDEQIIDIENHFTERAEKRKKRRAKKTDQQRRQERDARQYKNFKRLGIKLNAEQLEMVIAGLDENVSLREPWQVFWLEWKQEFLTLLQHRQESGLPLKLQHHLNDFFYFGEQTHPEVIKANRARWTELTLTLAESLSPEQNASFVAFLDKLIFSLEKLAAKTPTPNLAAALAVPDECRYNANAI